MGKGPGGPRQDSVRHGCAVIERDVLGAYLLRRKLNEINDCLVKQDV